MERLLNFAKLPMTSDGEALSEPGAAICSLGPPTKTDAEPRWLWRHESGTSM